MAENGRMTGSELSCLYERDGFATLGEVLDDSATLLLLEYLNVCRIEQGLSVDAGIVPAPSSGSVASSFALDQRVVSIAAQLLDAAARSVWRHVSLQTCEHGVTGLVAPRRCTVGGETPRIPCSYNLDRA